MASSTEYSFKAQIASSGYHALKETTWNNVKEGDSVWVDLETNTLSKNVDPYACAICAKNQFFNTRRTVGHIPIEISHVYYFIKTEGGFINGSVISTKYRPSSIPSGTLQIPFSSNLHVRNRRYLKKRNFLILFMITNTVELTTKKAVTKKKLQLSLKLISQNQSVTRRMINQNWSVTMTVVVKKKKTSMLTLILMNQLTWPLINFCF